MAGEVYPIRESHFAHKFTRLICRCCLANEIGPEACYLLVQIVHTEDAKRYRGPVTFFNEQLIPLCGFANVKALDRARGKAIGAGWLHYQAGGKSRPGRYFVTIPKGHGNAPDTTADSDFHPGLIAENNQQTPPDDSTLVVENDHASGRKAGNKAGDKREVNGQHSSLALFPIPSPSNEGGKNPADEISETRPAKISRAEDVPLPGALSTPEFLAARDEWFAQRRSKRLSLREKYLSRVYRSLLPLGPADAAACLLYTVEKDYDGFFPERFINGKRPQDGGQHKPRHGAGQVFDPNASDKDPNFGKW